MTRTRFLPALAAMVLIVALPAAAVTVDCFLNIPSHSAFQGPHNEAYWVKISDLSYSFQNLAQPSALPNTPPANQSDSLGTGEASFVLYEEEIHLLEPAAGVVTQTDKQLEWSGAELARGQRFRTMNLALAKPGREPRVFMKFTLTNVRVEDTAGGRITLAAGAAKYDYALAAD